MKTTTIDKKIFNDAVDAVMDHALNFQEAIKIHNQNESMEISYQSMIDGQEYGVTIFNGMVVQMAYALIEHLESFTNVVKSLKFE